MSTEILLMASPAGKNASETALDQSSAFSVAPSTPPQLPTKYPACASQKDLLASSRESTPLSSVMDLDNLSTEPSSPLSANASASKPVVTMAGAPAKKKKLTPQEKEIQRIEKQFKELEKAKEKADKEAQKEAEKREREERKRAAAEEKDEKRRQQETEKAQKRKEQEEAKEEKRKQLDDAREEKRKIKEEKDAVKQAEVAAKEAEKKAKEEEKAKKERSQLRLGAFFVKKAPSNASAASSRRNSVSSIQEGSPAKPQLASVVESLEKEASDYEKTFPPFFLKPYTVLAPNALHDCDTERFRYLQGKLDGCLSQQIQPSHVPSLKRTLEEASHEPSLKRRKLGGDVVPVRDLVSKLNATDAGVIDLTGSTSSSAKSAIEALNSVSVKYLRFAEDVRPPYIGTYTKLPIGTKVERICRNPFVRALPKVNYDYDSEAEWDEPEEGDSCETEDEDSDAEDDEEDMAGFLDDEDDAPKRRNVMGNMEPVYTPMFWQEVQHQHGPIEVDYGSSTLDLGAFRISPLMVEAIGTIDPFSTSYWKPAQPAAPSPAEPGCMPPPPRAPLNPLLGANSRLTVDAALGLSLKPPPPAPSTTSAAGQKPKGTAKPFPDDLMEEFKKEIDGNDLSKVGLIEVLKKKFPKVTGKTIQETLPLVARRDGKSKEAKWTLI